MAAFLAELIRVLDGESQGGTAVTRTARIGRVTDETQVLVELNLDGGGGGRAETGMPFFDHMLAQLGRHGLLDLTVQARGDLEVDAHHTVEDTAIALGQALREALGEKLGICRFGDALVPLDETLVRAAVDLSGRPYVVHTEPDGLSPLIGTYDTTLTRHFFESLGPIGGHLRASGRAARAQSPPHRGGAVQGIRAGAAGGGGTRSALRRRRAEHEGRPVSRIGIST